MVKSLEVKPSLLGKTNTALQMLLFISGICRPIWSIPSIQLFLPLDGIVSFTTVATHVTYALTINKTLKCTPPAKPRMRKHNSSKPNVFYSFCLFARSPLDSPHNP